MTHAALGNNTFTHLGGVTNVAVLTPYLCLMLSASCLNISHFLGVTHYAVAV